MAGTSDYSPRSSRSSRSTRSMRSRVAAIGGAALIAVGGAAVAAPPATATPATELPTQSSQDVLDTAGGIVRSAQSSVATSGIVAGWRLYYFVWCPVAVPAEPAGPGQLHILTWSSVTTAPTEEPPAWWRDPKGSPPPRRWGNVPT